MATLEVVVGDNPVRVDAIDGIGERYTLEPKVIKEEGISTKKISQPRLMQEFTLRRQIKDGMEANAFHDWYKKGEPRDITIRVHVTPEGSAQEVVAFKIILSQARPTQWFFEYHEKVTLVEGVERVSHLAEDCLRVIAQNVSVS